MHTQHTITSSFLSNIAKHYLQTLSHSRLYQSRRKFPSATTLSLKKSDVIPTTYTCSSLFLQNTAVQRWYGYSKALPLNNCFRNFLRSEKNSGAVNSGVTVSTWQQSASGETGIWSSSMSRIRERRCANRNSYDYSLRSGLDFIPRGSAPR